MRELVVREEGGLPVEARLVAQIERAEALLEEAATLDEQRQVEGFMKATLEWARRQEELSLSVFNRAQLLWLEAQAKQGEALGLIERRGRGEYRKSALSADLPPSLTELGYKHKEAERLQRIASVSREMRVALAASATEQGVRLTQKTLLEAARKLRQPAPPATNGKAADRSPCPDWIPGAFRNEIVVGDARELACCIPDESIAVCFCDPVYSELRDYEWLARECERVLEPGGSLVVQCGNGRRYECETVLRQSGLQFVDLVAEVYPYGIGKLFKAKTFVGWKPYLWFSKGPRKTGWVVNRFHAGGKARSDESKEIHEWGDSEEFAAKFLPHLCDEQSVLWDPFAGSGTVPVVAAKLGIPFVAFEIDPATAEKARGRLAGTERETGPQIGLDFGEGEE